MYVNSRNDHLTFKSLIICIPLLPPHFSSPLCPLCPPLRPDFLLISIHPPFYSCVVHLSVCQLTCFKLWDLSLIVSTHSDHAVCRKRDLMKTRFCKTSYPENIEKEANGDKNSPD